MKKGILIAAVTACAIGGLAFAEETKKGKAGKGGKGGSPEARAAMMIERADKDGDQKLDKEELVAFFKAMAARGGQGKGGKGGKGKTDAE